MSTLELAPRRTQIMPLPVEATREAMTVHQQQLAQIVDASDFQEFSNTDRRTGEVTTRRFLKRSGWRKIAFWYGLDLELVREELERDERGEVIRAHVVARARHPNGRYADGDGGCSRTERRFAKPEHDIAAVAVTRATNRSIANLVGAGDLSAEELDGATHDALPILDNAAQEEVVKALEAVWPTVDGVEFIVKLEKRFAGAIPEPVGAALRAWAWFVARGTSTGTAGPQDGVQSATATESSTTTE